MIPQFFTQMDKQALRAIAVVLGMFLVVAGIAIIGRGSLNLDEGQYFTWFEAFKQSEWIILIVLATFVIGSFIGVPQWALIAGMTVAFGPVYGGIGSWVCTMISASVNFWLARWMGAERIQKFGGSLINRVAKVVRRNGFVTSFVIRLVPTGPFVLVNMAAGVSKMKYPHFMAGTGLGIIPKILIVGLISTGVVSDDQSAFVRAVLIGAAFVFILIMLFARRYLQNFVKTD